MREKDKMTISKDDVAELNADDLTEGADEQAKPRSVVENADIDEDELEVEAATEAAEEATKGEQPAEPTDVDKEGTAYDDKEVAADSPKQPTAPRSQVTDEAPAEDGADHMRMVPGTNEPIFPIDRKYKGTVVKVDDMQVVGDWMVFRAQDKALVPTLFHYISICEHLRCTPEHIEGIRRMIGRVVAYQDAYPEVVKVPD